MLIQKFSAIESELNALYFERKEVVRGLLTGLLARQHVLLLGPPGTAKSELAENLCRRTGGGYFRWLLSRTSAPEELLGPVSLKALENDSYTRVTTGKLPEARVAFLDEIFKANSAILNSLLGILNERLFFNNGTPTQVPLQSVVGASNELPEDREELGALWDRFLLRYVVGYLRDPRSFESMLQATTSVTTTFITEAELAQAQAEARLIDVTRIVALIPFLRQKMLEKGVSVSDRRWKQSISLIQAHAWLSGQQQAQDDDLAILSHVLWQEPEQSAAIRQTVMALANPSIQEAQDLLDAAMEIWQTAITAAGTDSDNVTAQGAEANAKLKKISTRLTALCNESAKAGKNVSVFEDAILQVAEKNKEVIQKCLGITV
ncbi:MAG: ATPase RavA [Syntrophomonadaceae bacterium]|nr:ATPase RavA [Bacillota bacterium]MBT9147461.1 ATPase RavA [Bacillota bacterium]